MSFIDSIKERAKKNKKRIVLPESMDKRVIEAASKALKEDIADIFIIGKTEDIKEISKGYDISKATIIDPYKESYTEELINEGIARETVSKIQQLRKNMDFNIVDRIVVEYNSNDEYEMAIKNFIEFISSETLAIEFKRVDESLETFDINGFNVGFRLTKSNK